VQKNKAIVAERKKIALQEKHAQEEEKRKRKEKRAALRENARLDNLQDVLLSELIVSADYAEFVPKMRIYDVRDPSASSDGIIIIGGFVGELVLTFTCLLDCIMANPQNQNFIMTPDMIESYLKDMFGGDECVFQNGVCNINLNRSLEDIMQGEPVSVDSVMYALQEPDHIFDHGLSLILAN